MGGFPAVRSIVGALRGDPSAEIPFRRNIETLILRAGAVIGEVVRLIDRSVQIYEAPFAEDPANLRTSLTARFHLDELFVSNAGRQMCPWRAVDDEGEVLDVLVQARCAIGLRHDA